MEEITGFCPCCGFKITIPAGQKGVGCTKECNCYKFVTAKVLEQILNGQKKGAIVECGFRS